LTLRLVCWVQLQSVMALDQQMATLPPLVESVFHGPPL